MITKYGYYKIASGSFFTHLGEIEKNAQEILNLINKAKSSGVSVLSFSELSLTGYTSQDLFLHAEYSELCFAEIKKVIKEIPDNMVVIIGAPFYYLNNLYNVAYVLKKNKILGIVPKTYIPNYNEFYEKRWFSSSKNASFDEVILDNENIKFGTDLVFSLGELKIGVEICEDLWVINPPSNDLVLAGANLIVNLSASNEYVSKKVYREDLVKMQSAKLLTAYMYQSSGEGESSQDLVFVSDAMVYSCGKKISSSYDKLGLNIGIIDTNLITNERMKYKSSFEENVVKKFRFVNSECEVNVDLLPEEYDPYPFIPKTKEKIEERTREIISLQAKGLIQRLIKTKCKTVVLGVSGGLDSTLALLVCIEAFDFLKYSRKGIYALSLPGFGTSSLTYKNAKKLIEISGATYIEIDIKKATTQHLKDINHSTSLFDVVYENSQARERTQILMDYSNMVHGFVVGTGDLSELALGWCTYNADHMSMYAVNSSVPKTLVKYLISSYALMHKEYQKVLESILATPISPELLPNKKGEEFSQKTENILGKYDLHDFFLFNFIRNGFSKEKIYKLAIIAFKNISKEEIKIALDLFFKRFFSQQFKRSCLPDGPKIGSVSLSPRGDFRMASDIDSDNSFNK